MAFRVVSRDWNRFIFYLKNTITNNEQIKALHNLKIFKFYR